MGSITLFIIHNPNNEKIKVISRCTGDRGEVEEQIELEFNYSETLAKRHKLNDNSVMGYYLFNKLKTDVEMLLEYKKEIK